MDELRLIKRWIPPEQFYEQMYAREDEVIHGLGQKTRDVVLDVLEGRLVERSAGFDAEEKKAIQVIGALDEEDREIVLGALAHMRDIGVNKNKYTHHVRAPLRVRLERWLDGVQKEERQLNLNPNWGRPQSFTASVALLNGILKAFNLPEKWSV